MLELLLCPICQQPLQRQERALVCEKAHNFDLAKEGYVNLLHKKQPGDTREMVQARRTFFEHGFYQPLSDLINQLVIQYLTSDGSQPITILDAGCGEGYYLGRLHAFLAEQRGQTVQGLGIDISKEAIRLAAKRYTSDFFLVANLKERLNLSDGSLQVILNIFAPRNVSEYTRILEVNGLLLIIIPGPEHLLQLRERLHLLTIEENKQANVLAQFAAHFALVKSEQISYPLTLQSEEIRQVVMMTPNYWHLSAETKQAMEELEKIETKAEFIGLVLQKKGA
ncbi:putative RNA methyltransferase [Tengunoibacter tsumagoiensis]|uniref:23S rRNA (Guanine(745)-N(1))-methyltransferase n=1 Tax=Tengunoibacter tsumagoiensis TaxID=2014871 RepID=A0A401ZV12_9CHLR|nr:methyltransferase domain-containing protein [Tengunoibacter tsumagoiensis]GCE10723.1 23S rRNA (guanine(745)-N(1))-methyltransferase [Tengunoibacter tsumagoiensis]